MLSLSSWIQDTCDDYRGECKNLFSRECNKKVNDNTNITYLTLHLRSWLQPVELVVQRFSSSSDFFEHGVFAWVWVSHDFQFLLRTNKTIKHILWERTCMHSRNFNSNARLRMTQIHQSPTASAQNTTQILRVRKHYNECRS